MGTIYGEGLSMSTMEATVLVGRDGDACFSSIDVCGLEREVAGPSFKHRFKRIQKANSEEIW